MEAHTGEADMRIPQANYLMLPARQSAVRSARSHVRRVLAAWGLETMTDDVELLVSEPVTNSVEATAINSDQGAWDRIVDPPGAVYLCISMTTKPTVLIEVWDSELKPPIPINATANDEHGRGLTLVRALSTAWGTRWPETGGKIVWCECVIMRTTPG
jgi:anti-sigma regulatory factor (Ser/Thr protein kinase)